MSLTSQADPAPPRPQVRKDETWTPRFSPQARVATGIVLLAIVAAGGWYFSKRPGPTAIDSAAYRIIPNEWRIHPLLFLADSGRPRVVVPAVVFCFFVALLWSRRRAVTCAVAPGLAVAITEYVAKPAVGRLYGGTLCYPSGHMTAVAAVVCVFVLAVPPRLRVPAFIFGCLIDGGIGVVLMLLRWHYLTDVVAGIFVAVATTLLVDTGVHLAPVSWLVKPRKSAPTAMR
jgi:membrane-associated phospholipid phosphatase